MLNKDVIQRAYLQQKLNRDRREFASFSGGKALVDYIDSLKAWLKQSVGRTQKKGGLGR